MRYTKVKPEELRDYGRRIGKVLYLRPGVHVNDRKPDPVDELFIREKQRNPHERHVI